MTKTAIDIRCYCHGLGDCLLLRLPGAEGKGYWMLVDCGVHSSDTGGPGRIREVVEDIHAATGGHIDVVVGTHEHWDHLSGFLQAADEFAKFTIGEVWFSWAENPRDPDARKLDRFKADAALALAGASATLAGSPRMRDVSEGTAALLGFVFGAKGEKVRDAREALRGLAPMVRHLNPGDRAPLPEHTGVRCFVLGPPRDPKLLGIEDVVSETYAFGGAPLSVAPLANGLSVNGGTLRVSDDPAAPFDGSVGADWSRLSSGDWTADTPENARFAWNHYLSPEDAYGAEQDWRRVDQDWLGSSVDIALQLDARTNNTSLVLALEIVDSGHVVMLAADAQIGNWMSWPSVRFPASGAAPATDGSDLISRTVFYKVGHHGSRNATRASALEMMDHENLVAFTPTNEAVAKKVRWSDFPAPKTKARLAEVTSGRFVQSDAPWIHDPAMRMPTIEGGALLEPMSHPTKISIQFRIG